MLVRLGIWNHLSIHLCTLGYNLQRWEAEHCTEIHSAIEISFNVSDNLFKPNHAGFNVISNKPGSSFPAWDRGKQVATFCSVSHIFLHLWKARVYLVFQFPSFKIRIYLLRVGFFCLRRELKYIIKVQEALWASQRNTTFFFPQISPTHSPQWKTTYHCTLSLYIYCY